MCRFLSINPLIPWLIAANTLASLDNLDFTNEELKEIDRFATEGGINIWKVSSDL